MYHYSCGLMMVMYMTETSYQRDKRNGDRDCLVTRINNNKNIYIYLQIPQTQSLEQHITSETILPF